MSDMNEKAYRKQRVHGLPDEDFWAIMRGDAEIALVPIGLEKEADEIVSVLNAALPPLRARDINEKAIEAAGEAIYNLLPYSEKSPPIKPPWVPRGNSFKQDEARHYARAALTAATAYVDREVLRATIAAFFAHHMNVVVLVETVDELTDTILALCPASLMGVEQAALPPLRAREEMNLLYREKIERIIDNWTDMTLKRGSASSWHYGELWTEIRDTILSSTAWQPPRAREEIARTIAPVIAGLDLRNVERARAAANEAAGAVLALSSAAGQEWRDRLGEALLPFGLLARRCDHHKAPDDEIVCSHGAFGKSGDRGYTHITVGDLRRAAALLNELAALPAPPVAEPLLAEKRDES